MGQDLRVDNAADVEVGVEERVEPVQRADPVVVDTGDDGHFTLAGFFERLWRDRINLEHKGKSGAGAYRAAAVENDRL